MRSPRLSPGAAAILPWMGVLLLWIGVIAPIASDQEGRLSKQSATRRDRLKAERAVRESAALKERLGRALESACRASSEPSALRQRAVFATSGLALSPFSLSVTGGAQGGAMVEASGSKGAALALVQRLGDPSRGGFLRSVTLKEKTGRWSASAVTGVLDVFPAELLKVPAPCAVASDPLVQEPEVGKPPKPTRVPVPVRAPSPREGVAAPEAAPTPVPPSAPPFTLVAFLSAGPKTRVSIKVGEEVRVISVGDSVNGWTCLSIDRDEGAAFRSPANVRIVLNPAIPERGR